MFSLNYVIAGGFALIVTLILLIVCDCIRKIRKFIQSKNEAIQAINDMIDSYNIMPDEATNIKEFLRDQ